MSYREHQCALGIFLFSTGLQSSLKDETWNNYSWGERNTFYSPNSHEYLSLALSWQSMMNPILISRKPNFMQRNIYEHLHQIFCGVEVHTLQFLWIKLFQHHLKCHSIIKPFLWILLMNLNFSSACPDCVCMGVCVCEVPFLFYIINS